MPYLAVRGGRQRIGIVDTIIRDSRIGGVGGVGSVGRVGGVRRVGRGGRIGRVGRAGGVDVPMPARDVGLTSGEIGGSTRGESGEEANQEEDDDSGGGKRAGHCH